MVESASTGGLAGATAMVAAGAGRWSGAIAEGWDIAGNANGGYLLAVAARAMAACAERPDPVTLTAHYLSPGKSGPVEVEARTVKAGRRFTTVMATLSSAERPLLAVLGTFGDLSTTSGPQHVEAAPPDLPPPDDCPPVVATDTFPPPFMAKVELRLHPDDSHFLDGEPSGELRIRGWFRLRDGEPIDTVALLVAVDAFPPTAFNARLPVAWTPTVELTAHVRARPAPGWMRCSFRTRFVTGGFLEEDGEIWDDTDRLVAQSRQLALVPLT